MSAPRLLAPTTISGGVPTAGAGTLNTIALWTPDGNTLGNSLLTQSGNIVTNASGAIRANGTTQTSPAFTRHDTTTSGIYFPATNEIGFTISSQHAMFISSGRLVGMGTTNPGGRLDVVGVAGLSWAIRAQVSSANTLPALNAELGLNLKNTSSTVGNYTSITNRDSADNANTQINFINVNNSGSGAINFVTRDSVGGSAERVRITETGNVGIGTANPLGPLDTRDATGGVGIATIYTGAITANVGGKISFGGYFTGVAPTTWASIVGGKDNNTDGNFAGHLQFLTRPSGGSQTERARIDSSGNVGIGTTSPASVLHVRNNTAGITLDSTLGSGRQYQLNQLRTGVSNAGFEIRDVTAGAAVISIDASQNVGIGTASPGSILDVLRTQNSTTNAQVRNLSTGAAAQARMDIVSDASTLLLGVVSSSWTTFGLANGDAYISNNSARIIQFGTGGSERMRISGTAAQLAIGTTSFTTGRALTTVADLDVFGVRVGRGTNGVTGNTALGDGVFASGSLSGAYNVAVGYTTGAALTTGQRNTFLGGYASGSATTAQDTVSVGYASLYSVTTTSGNVAIGFEAGRYLSSGSATTQAADSVFVGRDARPSGDGESNQIVIGTAARGNGSNTATLGNASTVSIHLDAKFVRLVDSYTVATLPAAGTAGRIARVTDGDAALAWGATVVNTGAGATPYLVWDNGTNWTVFGK